MFRVLFSHWNEFLKYRNTIAEDKVLEDLERKKRRQKKKEAEQRRLDEEKVLIKIYSFLLLIKERKCDIMVTRQCQERNILVN